MEEKDLRILLEQYFANTIDRKDCLRLLEFLDTRQDDEQVHWLIDAILKDEKPDLILKAERKSSIYQNLQQTITESSHPSSGIISLIERQPRKSWLRVASILLVILLSGAVVFWYIKQKEETGQEQQMLAVVKNDILLSNEQQAILTLADGRTVNVDEAADALLAKQDGVQVMKGADGSISYAVQPNQDTKRAVVKYNTLSTPKGSSYQLMLSDGTKVWLNTASSIRFPISFTDKERRVMLQGEAYFEVAKDTKKPFFVEANQSLIQVLGTSFNVSAYKEDQQVTTTLLEGGVSVASASRQVVLKPGRQAVVDVQTRSIRESVADIRAVTAWKEGFFRFDGDSIETIMKELARWYDIEEVIDEGHSEDTFSGTFHRSKSIKQFFQSLEKMSSMKFEIQGRRVKIMR